MAIPGGEWESAAREALAGLTAANLRRTRRLITPIDTTHISWQGRRYVNFASNDYLGLAHHPAVIKAVADATGTSGAGSSASALITGYGPAHAEAEEQIASWKGTESAVLLPSGYQANLAAVQTLAAVARESRREIRFLLDKLSHASLIDAVRATGATYRIFPHNHLGKLKRLLCEADATELQVVITESIFSMDGDAADLSGLADLKKTFPFMLMLDEAHASGVYGPDGSGLAAELGLGDIVDVAVITLSKAIGSGGGAVCGSRTFCEALINFARAYIYSTSLPPALAAAAVASIAIMKQEPQHQQRVRLLARRVRQGLKKASWELPAGDSPIIPLLLGTESAALQAAEGLLSDGLFVLAIRPPTVPRGSSRLRVTLSSSHTDEEADLLVRELGGIAH